MKKVATIILNRNLPRETEALVEQIQQSSGDLTDIYVVESGSNKDNLSKYCSYWADWEESMEDGLRYPRGFNYGLSKLLEDGLYSKYEFFFLVCNDADFGNQPVVRILTEEMEKHPRVGVLSPCSELWGERQLLGDNDTKYFWYINHISWFMRRPYIDSIRNTEEPSFMNFLYDGDNFRGYESDIELVAKGYANDWASAITSRVNVHERESLLKERHIQMKTDDFDSNRSRLVIEGKRWLRRKYGFNSRWSMQMYAKFFYEKFFEFYPEETKYRI